ncbi:MAG: extracellular solute-binding protein [Clostridiales bacterium]|nr:extracellular solute-binding protein [Clostridiales bacterium]
MKQFRKMTCLLLALLLCFSMTSALAEDTAKIANGDVTLTIYIAMRSGATQVYTDYSQHPVVQQLEEKTGLNLEFIHPTADEKTFFNVTVASNEWPDLWVTNSFSSYPGGVEGAMEDGVLLNINSLVEESAPNFTKLVNEYGVMSDFISDTGAIVTFGQVMNCDYTTDKAFLGFIAREDVMKENNIASPETYAQWEEMLKGFQAAGFETPLVIPFADGNLSKYSNLAAGFGVTHDGFFIQGEKVVFSPILEGYRDYLRLLKDWYDKGYYTSDSFGYNVNDAKAAIQEGKAAVAYSHAAHTTTVNSVGSALDESFSVTGLKNPRQNEGDILYLVYRNPRTSTGPSWFVSATTKYPEECVRFVDYLYTEEAQLLTAWGYCDENTPTYEIVDGMRMFTEFMSKNPDGLDFQIMKDRYILAPFQTIYAEETEVQQYNYPEKLQAIEHFGYNVVVKGLFPAKATMTVDESSEYARIMSQIETYTDEMMQKFITGAADLDADWDTYVKQVEALNIARACQIKQESLERYNAR